MKRRDRCETEGQDGRGTMAEGQWQRDRSVTSACLETRNCGATD